jgi:hypothetical protein
MASALLVSLQQLIDDIRLDMRDYAELNRLLEDEDGTQREESSNKMIAKTIRLVLDRFNSMPPNIRSTFGWDNFPDRTLLITGVIGRLQMQVADVDDRNFYPASDGQVSIPSRQKGQLVRNAGYSKWTEFINGAKELRISLNYREALGGIGLASEEGMILLDDYLRGRMSPSYSNDPFVR